MCLLPKVEAICVVKKCAGRHRRSIRIRDSQRARWQYVSKAASSLTSTEHGAQLAFGKANQEGRLSSERVEGAHVALDKARGDVCLVDEYYNIEGQTTYVSSR